MVFRSLLTILWVVSTVASAPVPARADEPFEIHYAPAENLEHVDVAMLNGARTSIDLAAFVLTDWPVIDALRAAASRGVRVRVLLDPTQRSAHERFGDLREVVRVKAGGPLMHLKAYAVDGRILRTGSANFSASGLKHQDNDLMLIRLPGPVQAFQSTFSALYARAEPMRTD